MAGEISRRELFSFWRRRPEPTPDPTPLRPPGALPEAAFLDACQRCGKCVDVCPRQALGPLAAGPAAGTPHFVPRQAPCVVCEGLQCTHVCPSGALKPLGDPTQIRIGTAAITPDRCLAYRGQACAACVDICPIPGALRRVAHGSFAVPQVDAARCIGCGLCENYCPPEPAAIRVLPRRQAP